MTQCAENQKNHCALVVVAALNVSLRKEKVFGRVFGHKPLVIGQFCHFLNTYSFYISLFDILPETLLMYMIHILAVGATNCNLQLILQYPVCERPSVERGTGEREKRKGYLPFSLPVSFRFFSLMTAVSLTSRVAACQ